MAARSPGRRPPAAAHRAINQEGPHLHRWHPAKRSSAVVLEDPGGIADDLLARFDLTDAAGRRVATYSGGMRRRLDIAMTLIGHPPVLFLDEPTTGLDPQSRIEVWRTVHELAGQGTTVLLTTQYLDEAERLADRIAVLHEGRVIANGTLAELKQLLPPTEVEYVEKQPTLEDIFLAIVGQNTSGHR